ncbi:hypothetical protein NHF50_10150 [Flavobacterium sp. NRK F10]|uniref:hypothetical protein n=1 Tax=Flavobacterium sp. NRK F10 TaxID=2954931 RepID=UPI0020911574|nr:hypothetical protein [Flavobacterium sp. NRK F10]MCO6175405.1 hypothetical protein [Flavobacterium sp. NRK F10]
MKTIHVYDSSGYYVTKLMSAIVAIPTVALVPSSTQEAKVNDGIIFIVNDLNDFIDYLIIREKVSQIFLVVTCTYLIGKLSLTQEFSFYTFPQFETYLLANSNVL